MTSGKIANDAVTSDKIADGTIVNADISDTAEIDSTKILLSGLVHLSDWRHADNLEKIDGADIYDGSVGTPQLADNAVTLAKMATGAVGSSEIANGSVTLTDLGCLDYWTGSWPVPYFTGGFMVELDNLTNVSCAVVSCSPIGGVGALTAYVPTVAIAGGNMVVIQVYESLNGAAFRGHLEEVAAGTDVSGVTFYVIAVGSQGDFLLSVWGGGIRGEVI